MRGSQAINLDANQGPSGFFEHMDDDIVALLSCHHIQMLGIDLNYHISYNKHLELAFRTPSDARKSDTLIKRRMSLLSDRKHGRTRKVNMKAWNKLANAKAKQATTKLS